MARLLRKSKRWLAALVILAGLIGLRAAPLPIAIAATVVAGLTYPAALRPLKSITFWFAIGLLVIIVPIFAGVQDRTILWFDYSSDKLAQTWLMALRGIVVFLLIQVLTVNLDSEKFARRLSKLGNRNFVTLYELSREIIPNARHILNTRLKKQRRFSIGSLRPGALLNLISQVFVDLIHLAERLTQTHQPRLRHDPTQVVVKIAGEMMPVLIVVTGEPGTGKSTWLRELCAELARRTIAVGGVLTTREYVSESTWNLVLTDIAGGERRLAATMEPHERALQTEHYYFDSAALDWGSQRLATAAADWLIVDEVGIFEFNLQGFFPALKQLSGQFSGVLVLSLRKSLLVELDDFLAAHLPDLHSWQRWFVVLDEAD
ncbi:MAG: nucleoside-triphosphatase [Candidatus Neomarinimicrobiota bacterium]